MRRYSSLIRHPGNAGLFTAVEMSVVSALAGHPLHLHAEGLRGTGKTTILRAARDTLPHIERITGCVYNCRPDHPHCPQHRNLSPDDIAKLGTESVPMPFFEISHSAKVGTVIGSIDIAALTDRSRPVAALLPGTLPRAHRGIIFVDEINRLADTSPDLADVLLDAMGTKPGRVQIEETGLPLVELPVEATVWAASNPDEDPGPLADIRRQLSDRFDLTVSMARPNRADIVTRILDLSEASRDSDSGRRLTAAYQGDSADGCAGEERDRRAPANGAAAVIAPPPGADAHASFTRAAGLLPQVAWPAATRLVLADVYIDFGLESLRAVEAMQQAASLRCAIAGRSEVGVGDLIAVAGLALRHRVDLALLARITAHLQSLEARAITIPLRGQDGLPQPGVPTPAQASPQPERYPGGDGTAQAGSQAGGSVGAQSGSAVAEAARAAGRADAQPSSGQLSQSTSPLPATGPAVLPRAVTAGTQRGGFGRLLARILGAAGGETASRATAGAASGAQDTLPSGPGWPAAQAGSGASGQMRPPGQTGPGGVGADGAGPGANVTAPPRAARSIFELAPDEVINLPEDVRRL